MNELIRLKEGAGVHSRGQGCWSRLIPFTALWGCKFSDSPPLLAYVTVGLGNAMDLPAWGIMDSFGIKIIWSWAENWSEGRSSLSPEHRFDDPLLFMFAEMGTESGCSACSSLTSAWAVRKKSPWGTVLCHLGLCPRAAVDVYRRGMSELQWQEPPALGSLFLCIFNACFWLVVLLNASGLLCCWNKWFHTFSAWPSLAQTAHVTNTSSETSLC